MTGLEITANGAVVTIITHRYTIEINTAEAVASVITGGVRMAALDIRSQIPKWDGEKRIEDDGESRPAYIGQSETDEGLIFTWNAKSALWDKIYSLKCDSLRVTYGITIKGEGDVEAVEYFKGENGSFYEFSEGYNPCISWYDTESHYFKASCKNHRWSVLMVPPMFCYIFRAEGIQSHLTFGLTAREGEHNFNSFDYNTIRTGNSACFYLSTDQSGHTHVNGEWQTPEMIIYNAEDENDALKCYSNYYFASGLAQPKPLRQVPRFWKGPMVCGWLEQYMQSPIMKRGICDLACEELYEASAAKLKAYGLEAKAMIIDDKWQKQYATAEVDSMKWYNLRAFADRRHAEGIATVLWFKLWDREGLEDEYCLRDDKGGMFIDPSHPRFLSMLDEIIYRLLSSDDGCYDCDGFKLDYAFIIPIGHAVKSYSGRYGVELLYDYMKAIYDRAKSVKPDALINCSPCHPYFAHICDQARLHDYDGMNRNCREDMIDRARLFGIANPNTLLDTDNAGFNTRRDTMRWLLAQPDIGVPDLYTLTPNAGLTESDIAEVAQLWREYNRNNRD